MGCSVQEWGKRHGIITSINAVIIKFHNKSWQPLATKWSLGGPHMSLTSLVHGVPNFIPATLKSPGIKKWPSAKLSRMQPKCPDDLWRPLATRKKFGNCSGSPGESWRPVETLATFDDRKKYDFECSWRPLTTVDDLWRTLESRGELWGPVATQIITLRIEDDYKYPLCFLVQHQILHNVVSWSNLQLYLDANIHIFKRLGATT